MNLLTFDFPGVTSQQYDELCRRLNEGAPLQTLAEFRHAGYEVAAHIAGPTTDGSWRIVDVWESDQALEQFRHKLTPLLDQLGIPRVAPQVVPVHNLVTR